MIKGRPIEKPTKTNQIGMNKWVSNKMKGKK